MFGRIKHMLADRGEKGSAMTGIASIIAASAAAIGLIQVSNQIGLLTEQLHAGNRPVINLTGIAFSQSDDVMIFENVGNDVASNLEVIVFTPEEPDGTIRGSSSLCRPVTNNSNDQTHYYEEYGTITKINYTRECHIVLGHIDWETMNKNHPDNSQEGLLSVQLPPSALIAYKYTDRWGKPYSEILSVRIWLAGLRMPDAEILTNTESFEVSILGQAEVRSMCDTAEDCKEYNILKSEGYLSASPN